MNGLVQAYQCIQPTCSEYEKQKSLIAEEVAGLLHMPTVLCPVCLCAPMMVSQVRVSEG